MWILAFVAGNTNLWVLSGHGTILSPILKWVFPYFTPGLVSPLSGCINGHDFAVWPPLLQSCPATQGRVPGPPEVGAALTPNLGCPEQDPVGTVSSKATRVEASSHRLPYLHTNPHFHFFPVFIRQGLWMGVSAWIWAESPLMIHAYFSQTPDVSEKYILVSFLIGFEGRGELCQALLWFIDKTIQFYHCLVRWHYSMWQPGLKFSLTF